MSNASGSAMLAGNPASAEAAAGSTGGAPAASTTQPANANGTWYDNIEDSDLKGYLQNKGWKDPTELAVGYRNLEKLVGHEKVPLPKGNDDAEGWARVYDALGRPKEAGEYKLAVPEGADPAFAQQAASKFHELGLSARQASALTEWWNGQAGSVQQAQMQAQSQATEQQLNTLKGEWGQAWDENLELGRRAARQFGLDEATLTKMENGMGTADMLKFMSRIGRGLTEHTFESGRSSTSFGMTPEAAKNRISALQQDPEWTTKYLNGNADARAEMSRLMTAAFPE